MAERALAVSQDLVRRAPMGFGHLLCALDFALATPTEIAFVGDPEAEETRALVRAASRAYLPDAVLALARADADPAAEVIPLLRDRTLRDGRATAYVCERLACKQPVTDVVELREQLGIE